MYTPENRSGWEFDPAKAAESCIQWIRDWFDKNGRNCNAVIGISGGKDSTVAAALCVKALSRNRVIGILLPDGIQPDIKDSIAVVHHLNINSITFNIQEAKSAMLTAINIPSRQSLENLPPRLRMSALYFIAQTMNGRVSCNGNLSENWVGYSTIYGDSAGDFAPLANFTVSEIIEIGRYLEIPEQFLVKPPSDGLCGKTDEEKLGFTYAELDRYIRTGKITNAETKNLIDRMHDASKFKRRPMAAFDWNNVRTKE